MVGTGGVVLLGGAGLLVDFITVFSMFSSSKTTGCGLGVGLGSGLEVGLGCGLVDGLG